MFPLKTSRSQNDSGKNSTLTKEGQNRKQKLVNCCITKKANFFVLFMFPTINIFKATYISFQHSSLLLL